MEERIKELILENNFKEIKALINDINSADIADILNDLKIRDVAKIYRLLKKDVAAEVFAELDVVVASELLEELSVKEGALIIEEIAADDATDVLEEMPANVVDKLLKMCSPTTRKDINRLLNYKEDSAGSIMTVEYAELKSEYTVEKAISVLKKTYEEYETINTCFIVDKNRHLVGQVKITDLLFSERDTLIEEITDIDIDFVNTSTDQEEVADLFKRYNLSEMAVVDSEKRLVGIITIDDVVDVLEEEASEDIAKISGMLPTEKPYLKLSLMDIYKSRMPWLLFLMISATFTGAIISHFEGALASAAVLTVFMPMVMGTGGNAGGQSSVTVIRALSLDEIEFKDAFKVLMKEATVGIICGFTLSFANFFKLIWFDKVSVMVSLVVCLSLFLTVLFAKIIGAILPILADKVKLDPAVMANPIITTIVDAGSLFVYFQVASILLGL